MARYQDALGGINLKDGHFSWTENAFLHKNRQ